ncbi:unnamed protein product [Protopolystoma xenopodis]|uniref:Uncharacterized protein n=1 Tax=Protopolystoma xenopodis TaxID=117903 RepID=A0A448XE44_9PLAT|nr:unnamed protein product [Protopolystoma xenopodis]
MSTVASVSLSIHPAVRLEDSFRFRNPTRESMHSDSRVRRGSVLLCYSIQPDSNREDPHVLFPISFPCFRMPGCPCASLSVHLHEYMRVSIYACVYVLVCPNVAIGNSGFTSRRIRLSVDCYADTLEATVHHRTDGQVAKESVEIGCSR